MYIYIYIFIYNELGYLTQENPFERVNALCFTVNRDFFSPWIACFSFLWMKKFAKVKKKRLRQKMVKSITGLPPTPTTSSYSFHPIYSTPSLHKHDVNSLSYIAPAPATQTYVAPLRQMVTKEQTTSMKSWGFGFTYMFFLLYVLLFTGKTRLQDKENDRRFKKIALFLFFPTKMHLWIWQFIPDWWGLQICQSIKHSLSKTFYLSGK